MTTSTPRHNPPTAGELTRDELKAMMLATGRMDQDKLDDLAGALHGDLFTSKLRDLLAGDLLRLGADKLTFCTRTSRNSPDGCPAHGLRWS